MSAVARGQGHATKRPGGPPRRGSARLPGEQPGVADSRSWRDVSCVAGATRTCSSPSASPKVGAPTTSPSAPHIVRERAKIGWLGLHDLRYAVANHAGRSGENQPQVGKLLGHRRNRTTAGLCATGPAVTSSSPPGVATVSLPRRWPHTSPRSMHPMLRCHAWQQRTFVSGRADGVAMAVGSNSAATAA